MMGGMDDLVQFLRARYDDDERNARKRAGVFPSPTVRDDGSVALGAYPNGTSVVLHGPGPDGYDDLAALKTWASAEHGWTQARVLAEVDAKRRLLREYEGACRAAADSDEDTFDYAEAWVHALQHALRFQALPYADHPEYQDLWRPRVED